MRSPTLAIFLLLASISMAQDVADLPFERLSKVGVFAIGGIGYAGVKSQGEKDYREILQRSSARSDFEKLLSVGDPQAKSYALLGIRVLDRKRFERLSRSVRDSKVAVTIEEGCIMSSQPIGVIVERISTDLYSRK